MKIKIAAFCLIFCCIALGCKYPTAEEPFHFPVLINVKFAKADKPFSTDSMLEANNRFVNKFPFCDTVDFAIRFNAKDTSSFGRKISPHLFPGDGLEVFIDTTVVVDYQGPSYPMYIVNNTKSNKVIYPYTVSLEAEKNWGFYPIEYFEPVWCGVGRYFVTIKPREFILILIRKYSGSVKTKIRASIPVGDNIIKSAPFSGSINPNQFYYPKNSYPDFILRSNDLGLIIRNFSDGVPMQLDTSKFR